MSRVLVLGTPPPDVDVLAQAYAVDLLEPGTEPPQDSAGHLVVATPLTVAVARSAARRVRVHGLAVVVDGQRCTAVEAGALAELAALGVPALVLATTDPVDRARGQEIASALPDAVVVLTEADTEGEASTTVQWLASFFSIVDGLRNAGLRGAP